METPSVSRQTEIPDDEFGVPSTRWFMRVSKPGWLAGPMAAVRGAVRRCSETVYRQGQNCPVYNSCGEATRLMRHRRNRGPGVQVFGPSAAAVVRREQQ